MASLYQRLNRKDSSEYGWLVITRDTYECLREQGHAGTGTPGSPEAPGHWVVVPDRGATVLYTGVTIDEAR